MGTVGFDHTQTADRKAEAGSTGQTQSRKQLPIVTPRSGRSELVALKLAP